MGRKTIANQKQIASLLDCAMQNGGLLKFKKENGKAAYFFVEGEGDEDGETYINKKIARELVDELEAKLNDGEPEGRPITEAESCQLAESRAELLQMLDYSEAEVKNSGDAELIKNQRTGKMYLLTADLTGERWEIEKLRD